MPRRANLGKLANFPAVFNATSAYLTHCNIPTLREMKNVLSVVLVVAAVGALASPVPAVGQVEVSGRYHSGQIERPI